MKSLKGFGVVVLVFSISASVAMGQNDSSKVVKTEIKKETTATGQIAFSVHLNIEKGWHVYANPVGNPDLATVQTTVTVKSGGKTIPSKVIYPLGHFVKDPLVGDYSTYEEKVALKATVPILGDAKDAEVVVKFQACNDKTCLPPAQIVLKLP